MLNRNRSFLHSSLSAENIFNFGQQQTDNNNNNNNNNNINNINNNNNNNNNNKTDVMLHEVRLNLFIFTVSATVSL